MVSDNQSNNEKPHFAQGYQELVPARKARQIKFERILISGN